MLLARYIAEFSMLYPAALLCYLPLSGFLRLRVKALCPLVLSVVTAFVLLGSAVCMRFQLKTNALLLPMMAPFMLLYVKSVKLPLPKALFVFFTASTLTAFSTSLTNYLCAPIELHNSEPVFALSSGLICLAVSLIVLAVFSLLFRRKIHWMLCNVSFTSIWRALFAAPLFLTVVFIWITPWYPSVVLTGRMREISVALLIIFLGIAATFLYNYFANLLRAIGNSVVPLAFLAVSAILNVILDLVCVLVLDWGVKGAAGATVFSQYVSGVGIGLYTLKKFPQLCPKRTDCRWDRKNLANILNLSVMTSVQQSIMNFGILMVQGLVNSFGTVIMAAFAAAVKIDSFAYMPVQDFGNAFSTYVAQNYGANRPDRIKKGIRSAGLTSAVFCIVISVLVCAFAAPLMGIFIDPAQTEIIAAGVQYLRIEGACYIGIGVLFLLYGYYRAVNQPGMSVILTIASLGTRVALAYLLSATPLGVTGIWLSVPIGWALADAVGIGYYLKKRT